MNENPALPGYFGLPERNYWKADLRFMDAAGPRLTPKALDRVEAFGELAGGRLGALIDTAHRPENLPRLAETDLGGRRAAAVRYCPEQVEARRLLARAIYEAPTTLHERMTLAVLASYNGEGGITCPLAMTDGLVGLLERRGTAEQKAELLPRLKSDDPDWALTGGQFVTERQGGSNVGANETVARPAAGGRWTLHGTKWFCSNPGELWVTTAKPEGTNTVALFLVRRRRADGTLNGHKVLRLKEIGGTRGKATVEVEYEGAEAEMIGKAREGLAILVNDILSVSRLHVAAAALGFAGRAVLEAGAFAEWREAYGRRLVDIPAASSRLLSMRGAHRGMAEAFYKGLDAIAADAPDAEVMTPLLKIELSARATDLVREAQLFIGGHGILDDFAPLNRLADDALVNEIWEGTHPILAGHAAKALRRHGPFDAFVERVSAKAEPERLDAFADLVDQSLDWNDDERGLRDPEICAEAYALLSA